MCGEKALSTFSSRKNSGSPPRMRGKVQPDADGCRPPRITPAYAGKRRAAKRYKRLLWDHPRVCGEKTAPRHRLHLAKGSPPRMRGKEKGRRTHKVKSGITPAYAGKSAYLSPEDTAGRDHPRVCGEKYSWEKSTCKIFGSPPRMRGKAGLVQIVCRLRGITPAYAGKSHKVRLQAPGRWDHPRVCGEKSRCRLASGPWPGSPPRMRGKAIK